MIITGLFDLSFWGYVAVALALTHVTIIGVTVYLHRHQAHRALTLHPAVAHAFRFWLWLTTGMVTREWAAVHRKHHAKCETEQDPHSPQQAGIAAVLFGGACLYRKESANEETIKSYGAGTPDDWVEHNLYSRHRWVGIQVMLLVNVVLFGLPGFAIWLVQMLWIPFWAAGVINGVGHYWGYRNFETHDASRNIVPWGILIGGEELHNNHHAYGVSAKLSNKWWELDIGWFYIRTLECLGLASVKRKAPRTSFVPSARRVVDMDMLRTILANRFHVLKLYGNRVVRPVVKDECRRASGELKGQMGRLRKLLASEIVTLDEHGWRRAQALFNHNHTLQTIYEFKQRLRALWTQQYSEQREALARLQDWCADAEASGIAALQEFAQQLRGYRSRTA